MTSLDNLAVEDDLPEAWAKTWATVVSQFPEAAKLENSTKEDVSDEKVAKLMAIINPKHDTSPKRERAARIVGQVLECVQRFGSIVASGTATVFPASEQTFNALTFVITATQQYQKIFNDLTTLLERVSAFFNILNVYLEKNEAKTTLDKRLRRSVYLVLEHFMIILTLSARLTMAKGSFRKKAGLYAGVFFFGDDAGITEALATLETRVSDVVQVQVAVIGKDLSKASQDIRVLKGDMEVMLEYGDANFNILSKLQGAESLRQSDDDVRAWLHPDPTEPDEAYHEALREKCIAETGSWLFTGDENFARWCDPTSQTPSTILVKGGAECSKTFLAFATVKYL
jgi:putative lipoic acid-binding regulatory protein